MSTSILETTLPHSLEAEKAILGAVLMGADVPGDVDAEDFYLDAHRRIFEAMRALPAVDHITLIDHLKASGQLSAVGGLAYVASLPDGLPRKVNVEQYIRIVREKAQLREVIQACENAIAQAMQQVSVTECMTTVEEALLGIESRRAGNETYHLSEFLPQAIVALKKQAENNGLEGFTTGINALDNETTGIRRGELWVIGGLPNSGKTPLGTQIAMDNARNGIPTMIFSLEMSRFQLAGRIIASSGVVSAKQVRRPRFISDAEWAQLYSAEQDISSLPVWVNDASHIKLSELLMRAKLAIRQRGIQLIVVDYLMLVDAPGKQLREQADAVTNGLKALIKSQNVAGVLLSQFKRPNNLNDRPNLTWFKESGGIEATANTALAMYCPVGDDGVSPTGEYEIVITKQREGFKGSIPVHLDPKTLRFMDREA